ncbi:hypothetical protein D3C75_1306000 [compost metagenome]
MPIINGYRRLKTTSRKCTSSAARYLPMTISVRLAGEVSKSSSVPWRSSSDTSRMVKRGMTNR